MEYDIIVKSGADSSSVRFAYEGIKGLNITEEGGLLVELKEGSLLQKKPVIYQEIDGKRVNVAGNFNLLNPKSKIDNPVLSYSFEVGSYDKTYSLIIDPTLVYSTYLGGSNYDYGSDIAVDAPGNVYITGHTGSTDFPTVSPIYGTCGSCPSFDAFVTKIDASGSSLVYSTYIGGSGYEYSNGIAIDATGNVYITGSTYSTDFPTASPIQGAKAGSLSYDAFVTKIDASGSSLVYSTYLGGGGSDGGGADDAGCGIAVDTSGNAYITGTTPSTDFPTASPIYGTKAGGQDVFVAKINTSGSSLIYSTYLGGSSEESDYGRIAVDASGNAYITGRTYSTDFPTASPIYGTNAGGTDAFVTKIDASGSSLVYSTYLGGWLSDGGSGIAVDASGNVYITGTTYSPDYPTTSPFQSAIAGVFDVFVTKINASGTSLVYSTYLGGSDRDYSYGIAVDASGNAYISGYTNSTDFPIASPIYGTKAGGQDVFVTKINTSGSSLIYSTYLGGSGEEWDAGRIAVDASGNAYITGTTLSTDFPTASAYQGANAGSIDAFVTKISAFPAVELPRTGQTTCYDSAGAVISCAGTGQDGEIQAGVPWPNPRFIDNGDGTVTDNLTGLMWTRDANLPVSVMTWQQALDYVAGMNAGAYPNFGYTDWRLPNINELESLINAEMPNSAIWLNTQGFSNVQNGYWSSTTYAQYTDRALSVRMWYVMEPIDKSNVWPMWPVRSAQTGIISLPKTGQTISFYPGDDGEIQAGVAWPSPRFTVSGDCVADNLTGLMWTRNANLPGTDMTWQQALDYANNFTLCGYSDWRLPNRKELKSLVESSKYGPPLSAGHPFTNVSMGYSSSTTIAYFTHEAWLVDMWWSGLVLGQDKPAGYAHYVWPVRGGQVGPIGSTEICDGIDNDLDGFIDEGFTDTDSDGQADCVDSDDDNDGYSDTAEIAAGSDPLNAASTPEVCDGVDNDMDGLTDEGCPGSPATPEGTNVEVIPTENITLTFDNVTTSGTTTVTTSGTGQPPPSGFRVGSPPVYYDITTTATYSGSILVCLSYDETQFATERNLRLFHLEGGSWVDITDPGYPDTTNNIICGTTTSLSPFIIAEELSTAVTLQSFSARLDGNQVTLIWSTSFEIDNEGFIILRGESTGGPFTPITQGMIPAMGGSGKATYTFIDGNIEQGKTYYYQLQDIDSRGRVTAYQVIPVTVTVAKANEILQETTSKDITTTTASQQTRNSSNKETVGDEQGQTDKPGTWVSLVMPDSANKSFVSETNTSGALIEDAALAKKYYSGSFPEDARRSTQGPELHRQALTETTLHERSSDMESHHLSSGSSSFSVSIEDDKGNVIMVSKVDDTAGAYTSSGELNVTEESGRMVLSWQGKGKVRGFILHRAEKGKDNYTPISNLIPYFGQDGSEQYLYKYIDKAAKMGIQYDYRLEVVRQIMEDDLKLGKLAE